MHSFSRLVTSYLVDVLRGMYSQSSIRAGWPVPWPESAAEGVKCLSSRSSSAQNVTNVNVIIHVGG